MKSDSDQFWYSKNSKSTFLLPLAWLFSLAAYLRRSYYTLKPNNNILDNVFVVIVGNITVGGAGKTPFVAYLAKRLMQEGKKVGIVSRGYKREVNSLVEVEKNSHVNEVGDEAILLKNALDCPIVVSADRREAAVYLKDKYQLDVIISDDGLQHYNLPRNLEMVVVDGVREFGNQRCLPAGPLREPVSRLNSVDLVVCNGNNSDYQYQYEIEANIAKTIDGKHELTLRSFASKQVHAVAGIGNPSRFFSMLENKGIQVIEHLFPDHHPYIQSDLEFNDNLPILMTEKDAVKCTDFAKENMWYVPIVITANTDLEQKITTLIKDLK